MRQWFLWNTTDLICEWTMCVRIIHDQKKGCVDSLKKSADTWRNCRVSSVKNWKMEFVENQMKAAAGFMQFANDSGSIPGVVQAHQIWLILDMRNFRCQTNLAVLVG